MAPKKPKTLSAYNAKRDFTKTAEPSGTVGRSKKGFGYLIQKHAATRLHYDFRLELDGVLKSWAVTRGPSLDPHERRLAVEVEDHPVAYGSFEGTIPKGQYGGGTVMLWDIGSWEPIGDPRDGLKKGRLHFVLHGQRLKGEWTLVRMPDRGSKRHNWLLIKRTDGEAREGDGERILERYATSVTTNRSMEKIAGGNRIWNSNRGEAKAEKREKPGKKSARPAQKSVSAKTKVKHRHEPWPGFVRPQLATLASRMPVGSQWVHEVKFDGYRLQAHIRGGKVTLFTRTGLDWTQKFPAVARALEKLPVADAIIDGELVALDKGGVSSFKELQDSLEEARSTELQYYAFDLLYLNGDNCMKRPLEERKTKLEPLMRALPAAGRVFYSDHFTSENNGFYTQACRLHLEGVISKRRGAPYRSGRGPEWLKAKCHTRQEFIIGGFTLPAKGGHGIGALLLGYYDGDALVYAGRVGTGYTHDLSLKLRKKLEKLRQDKTPYGANLMADARRGALWVRPKLVCEVEFTEWTPDDRLRHPSFQGLREDKPATQIRREEAVSLSKIEHAAAKEHSANPAKKTARTHSPASAQSPVVKGVKISSPGRLAYPKEKITKLQVADYYAAMENHIMPHIAGRPISIIRCPDGIGSECFFQRHSNAGDARHIFGVRREDKPQNPPYIYVKDITGLIALVQWGVIEVHGWGSRADRLELADHIIFDLDPDAGVSWADVAAAAREVRQRMADIGLVSFLKTTGGKGLHVTVPLQRKHSWDVIKPFTRAVAEAMTRDSPDRFVATMSKEKRKGRIFVDYLRNEKTSTAVAPFSLRARPGATVATPLAWEELTPKLVPAHFTIDTVPRRLAKLKHDPWEEYFTVQQTLTVKQLKAFGIKA